MMPLSTVTGFVLWATFNFKVTANIGAFYPTRL